MRYLLILCLFAGCVKPNTKQCGDFTCGANSVCSPSGDRCVNPAAIDACQAMADGDACNYTGLNGTGVCQGSVCLFGGCGNGVVEPMADEVCDDGNNISNDGCRADCKSEEKCGDGVVEFSTGEQCDCGTTADNKPMICAANNSQDPDAFCREDCKLARCGDGVPDFGEVCDDGNNEPGDGCRADCAGRWTPMQSGTLVRLQDVAALSKDDAWAVGGDVVLHWNGSTWSRVPVSPAVVGADWRHVYVNGPGDIFVSGYTAAFHLSNGVWTNATPPVVGYSWSTMGGRGADIYLLGNLSSNGLTVISKFSGTTFGTPMSFATTATEILVSFSIAPDGRQFAGNDQNPSGNGGSLWYRPNASGTWNVQGGVNGNYISTPSDTSMFLFSAGGPAHHSTNSTTWTTLANSVEISSPHRGHAIATQGIQVGLSGGVIVCSTTSCEVSATDTLAELHSVAIVDEQHAFIVGANGTILY